VAGVPTLYRPAGIGLLLDRALGLYRANWRPIMAVALIVVFPAALLASIGQVFAQRQLMSVLEVFGSGDTAALQGLTAAAGWSQVVQMIGSLGSLAFAGASVWLHAGILAVAPELASGGSVTVRRLLMAGAPRFWMALAVTFVTGLVALVPIAGVVIALFWLLAVPIVVVEGATLDKAFGRSWKLVSEVGFWRTALFGIGLWIVVIALEQLAMAPNVLRQLVGAIQDPGAVFRPLSVEWTVFTGVLSALGLALVSPFTILATYLYYTDARARAEGMDLMQQAHQLTPSEQASA
jgi:hypothetical protein